MKPAIGGVVLWVGILLGAYTQDPFTRLEDGSGPDRPIVGAIRWDAWYGEGSPVSEVEKTLGPRKFHYRLPFFAKVISPGEVSINGDAQAVMDQEIAYAAEAGLDYWAFVDYWDQGNLGIALRRYREAPDKKMVRYCLIEEGRRLDHIGTDGWPRLVAHFQDPNYQQVLDRRPLLFVYGLPKELAKADFENLDRQAIAAGLKEPYTVLMGWNPVTDAAEMKTLGFDALSAYAAGVGYQWEQWPYERLTEHVRTAYWEACRRERLETITFATSGWDPRPRVEHPTPWVRVTPRPDPTPPEQQQPLIDAVTATPDQLSQHLREALAWTRANRDLNPANAIIIYGWNENDEGGWLIPTLQSDGQVDRTRVDALSQVLRDPARAGEQRAWWRDYHTLVSYSTRKEGQEWQLGMMAERGGWVTGWYGPWFIRHQLQRRGKYDAIRHVEHFREQGVKNVFYYDAGEFGEFVALVHEGELVRNQWELRFYQDEPGELIWFGKDGFYRDEQLLDLPQYREFGLPAWTLPDGTRPARLYELARTSFEGQRDPWDYSLVSVSPEISRALSLDAFLEAGLDPVPPAAAGSLGRICAYDHSNPFLLDDFQAGVAMMLSLQPAFLHFDNYFDNETIYPYSQAFGPWSIERFRQFAAARVDPARLRELGIGDPNQFDLKAYIQDKPFESRGHRWHFLNKRWHEDPVWNLFVTSKHADSDRLFRALYEFCKAESRRLGSEVVVVGNTVPIFPGGSLVSGAIDIVHFEHHAATQYGPVVVPTGLPPLGRLGGVVRLGAAVSSAGYCWPSVYVPQQLSGPGHENLHKVLAMDCLANKGVLDYNHQYLDGYSPGSDASAAWADCFIKNFAAYYGSRTASADVGLVFPGQTLLASVSVFTMDPEVCLYDYLGWSQALTELHAQWDVLLDDQLCVEDLAPFTTVVLPGAACLSDAAIAALRAYVAGGGRLVISGQAGTRYGPERFLWPRGTADTLTAQLSGVERDRHSDAGGQADARLLLCPDTPGKAFYMDVADLERSDGRDRIREVIGTCLTGAHVRVESDASATVGLFVFREPRGATAIDLVNYQVDPPTDRLTPAKPVRLVVHPGAGRRISAPEATVVNPDLRAPAEETVGVKPLTPWRYESAVLAGRMLSDGSAEFVVPAFDVYCRLSVATEPTRD